MAEHSLSRRARKTNFLFSRAMESGCRRNSQIPEKLFIILLSAAFGLTGIFPAGVSSSPNESRTVATLAINNVRLFDGEKVSGPTTVVTNDGLITAVGAKASIPSGCRVIDGTGKTLLPGLIDAHVHVWDMQSLRQCLVFGVTSVVDMFTSVPFMNEVKKRQAEGRAQDMAFMISPGTLATAPGGHGTQYGLPVPTLTKPEEAQAFVEARLAEGSDFIKIIFDNGSAYGMARPTLSLETVAALIQAAHQRNKLAIIHAATLQNCIDALNAGVDGLAHLFFNNAFDPDFGNLVARKKAFVIPTLSVLESMSNEFFAPSLTKDGHISPFLKPSDATNLDQRTSFTTGREAYLAAERAAMQLREAGVPILAGTDAPNPGAAYGASLHREFELLVRAGLTPLQALQAATSIPAEKFRLEGRGWIKPGMNADLVLVEGDPTVDIKATRRIVSVWKDGLEVDRRKYLEEVKKEKEAVEAARKAPIPEYAESGLISDFEEEKIETKFGANWTVSTDAFRGGKSKAELNLAEGGAQGSKKFLLITGTVFGETAQKWAGAMFSPGKTMMAPANLSHKKAISFWAKGEGKKYTVMVFSESRGFIPAIQYFEGGPEWKEYVLPYEKFGTDGHDIIGIFIGASENGSFALKIDDVWLK